MPRLLFACVLFIPFFAHAKDSDYKKCWNKPSHPEWSACFLKEEQHYLRLLEDAERKALTDAKEQDRTGMPREPKYSVRLATQTSGQAFKKFLDAECNRIMVGTLPGNGAGDFRTICSIELIQQRLKQLQD